MARIIKKIQKTILIIVSIISLLFCTLQPRKVEASATGILTLGGVPTLAAFMAATPAFAVAAVIGVAVFIAVGLTLDNWDEITAIGTAVINDMASKGIQVADFVSGTTVTWTTELKQSIQDVIQNPPESITTIPARNETHSDIKEHYLTANHWNTRAVPGALGYIFIGIREQYTNYLDYYYKPGNPTNRFNTTFGMSVRFPAFDITNGELEFYPYYGHPTYESRDEDSRINPDLTYQIDYLYEGNNLIGFDIFMSMEPPTEVIYPGSDIYYKKINFNQIRVNNYSSTESFAPRYQVDHNPEAGEFTIGNHKVFMADNTLVPDYTSPFDATVQDNLNETIFANDLVVTFPGDIALDGKNIRSLEEITDIALTDSQRETLEALPPLAIDAETPDANDNTTGDTESSGILGFLQLILSALLGIPQSIVDGIISGFSWIQDLLNSIWNAILSIPGAAAIATAIGNTFSWLQGLLVSIRDGLVSLPGLIASAVATSFYWLQGLLTNIWEGIMAIPAAIGDTFSWLEGLLTNIWQAAVAIPGATYDVLVDVFNLLFVLDQDWLQSQLQILVAELALKIPAVPNVVEMIAYKEDKDEWAGLYADFDHYGIGRQKVVDNYSPNYFRHTTKIIIRGFLYFLLALFFIRKVYIFADD